MGIAPRGRWAAVLRRRLSACSVTQRGDATRRWAVAISCARLVEIAEALDLTIHYDVRLTQAS